MKKQAKRLILIVDDNPDLVYSVTEGLRSLNSSYDIKGVYSGKECLNFIKNQKPDLIILDIMMPEMDGWDICAKIKSNEKTEKVPIIFLTAKTDPISRGMGKLASSDYIEKPFDMRDLKKRIDHVLKKSEK